MMSIRFLILSVLFLFSFVCPLHIATGGLVSKAYAQTDPAKIKAVFLYNFVTYMKWPDAPPKITICVYGDEQVNKILNYIGKKNAGFVSKIITAPDQATNCQVVFTGESKKGHIDDVLKAIGNRPILTVSDTNGFTDKGGAVGFVTKGGKIKLEIDTKRLETAKLKASYKLLELAVIVE